MKKELFNKWIKALKSGKYKQTTDELIKLDGDKEITEHGVCEGMNYCAIGVLAHVAGIKIEVEDDAVAFDGEYVDSNHELDGKGLSKVGLDEEVQEKVIDLNDDKGLSFKRIAAWLEKNRSKVVNDGAK